jgi:hypothetical protein
VTATVICLYSFAFLMVIAVKAPKSKKWHISDRKNQSGMKD